MAERTVSAVVMPASSEDIPEVALWRQMVRVNSAIRHLLQRFLEPEGVSLAQLGVIRVVSEAGPEGIKLNEIGEKLYVTCGNVTGLVDRVESLGYITRVPHPDDRRAFLARLTPAGEAFAARVLPEHRARIARLMGCLTSREQASLARLLEKLGRQVAQWTDESAREAIRPGGDDDTEADK